MLAGEKDSGNVPPLVLMGVLYGTPTMAFGSAVVVMKSVLMAMVSVCVAVCGVAEESVTLTVNVKTPAAEGVPLSNPLLLNARPEGSVPPVWVTV